MRGTRASAEPPRLIREPESGDGDAEQDGDPPALTVAVIGGATTRPAAQATVARLAGLATSDELVVIYGSRRRPGRGVQALVAGLRAHLPRHHVVAIHVAHRRGGLGREDVARLDRFLEDGSVPVVVAPAAILREVTAELSSYVRADRVLRVSGTRGGVDLHQVWRRPATARAN